MINFAHGEVFMAGAFGSYFFADAFAKSGFLDANPILAMLILTAIAVADLRRDRGAPRAARVPAAPQQRRGWSR